MGRVLTVAQALRRAAAGLGEDGRAEAETLLAHALGVGRSWLFAHADAALPAAVGAHFEALVAGRVAGRPLAYLTGRRGFWRFDLQVTPDTLIPRPESERLVELALARLPVDRPLRLLDLGTGTGAIALALACERRHAHVVAVEHCAGAAAVARGNARALALDGRVEVREGDWFVPVAGERFDLIASNPPYIAAADPHLAQGDLRFEPLAALAAGADGLDALRVIASAAPGYLQPGGWLLLEHGWRQGEAVRSLLQAAGFIDVDTALDLEARERVTLGRRKARPIIPRP